LTANLFSDDTSNGAAILPGPGKILMMTQRSSISQSQYKTDTDCLNRSVGDAHVPAHSLALSVRRNACSLVASGALALGLVLSSVPAHAAAPTSGVSSETLHTTADASSTPKADPKKAAAAEAKAAKAEKKKAERAAKREERNAKHASAKKTHETNPKLAKAESKPASDDSMGGSDDPLEGL
jgi:hypothetical protein